MACLTSCCLFSRGEFFISDYSGPLCNGGGLDELLCNIRKPYRKLGNVSTCAVNISSQVIGRENEFNPVHDPCPRQSVEGVNITITLECASNKNLYEALYSEILEDITGEIKDQFCIHALEECDFFPFSKLSPVDGSIVVTLESPLGVVVQTLVEDTDYIVTNSGIEILRDDIDLTNVSTLNVTYDYNTANRFVFNFGSKKPGYKTLFFKGLNYASGGDHIFNAVFHKVVFTPANTFDLINQDSFFTLTLSGTVEKVEGSWFELTKQEE